VVPGDVQLADIRRVVIGRADQAGEPVGIDLAGVVELAPRDRHIIGLVRKIELGVGCVKERAVIDPYVRRAAADQSVLRHRAREGKIADDYVVKVADLDAESDDSGIITDSKMVLLDPTLGGSM